MPCIQPFGCRPICLCVRKDGRLQSFPQLSFSVADILPRSEPQQNCRLRHHQNLQLRQQPTTTPHSGLFTAQPQSWVAFEQRSVNSHHQCDRFIACRIPQNARQLTILQTVKKSAKVIIERYYPKLTLDFETNKRICDEIAIIASKRLRNKVRRPFRIRFSRRNPSKLTHPS